MRVIEVKEFGGPEVLRTRRAPDPAPGPGEVLIEVAAVDTLLVETDLRAGRGAEEFGLVPPYVPGAGVAGTVGALGEDAPAGLLGARVVALPPDIVGGYAERVAVPVDVTARVPDAVTDLVAAALANDGATAMDLFEAARVRAGQQVLIVGATGGTGALLVQLARNAGARVAAAARGERKLALARELGADIVIDYSKPGWAAEARAATGGAQVVLDGVGGDIGAAAFEAVADGGRFSAHGAPAGGGSAAEIDEAEASRRGITLCGVQDLQQDPRQRRHLLARALDEAAAGRLRPVVGQTFPLDRAADAHAAIESRAVTGKTILLP